MTTISRTHSRYHVGTRRHGNKSIWYDAGIALAIVLAVLVMVVAGSQGKSGIQSYREWPSVTQQAPLHSLEDTTPAGLFPRGPISDQLAQ